jgi:hypothetical protein
MPRKSLLAVAVVLTAALVAAGAAFSHTATVPTLKGVVGPGYSIKLTRGGKAVKALKTGKYRFVIADKSSFHNFVVEREKPVKIEKQLTSTPFIGTTKGVIVNLKPGKWKFYCSVHESRMFGFFKAS